MNEIITRIINLPIGVNGLVVKDENDDMNIYINARLSFAMQIKAHIHELRHISRNDFEKLDYKSAETEI